MPYYLLLDFFTLQYPVILSLLVSKLFKIDNYYYPNNAEGSSWTVTTSQPGGRFEFIISTDVSDAVKQAFDNNLTIKTSSRVTNFSSLSQSFTDIIPLTLDSSESGPIDFDSDYNVVYYANGNDYDGR